MASDVPRRTLLKGVGAVGAGGLLAGCAGILGAGGGGGGGGPAHAAAAEVPECDDYSTLARSDLDGGATISAGCYRVDSTHAIDSGTLVLEAGVVIEFAEDAGLRFDGDGSLRTEGTPSEPVFLRGRTAERAFWQGLRFEDSAARTNLLEHVVIEHAGSSRWHGAEVSRAGVFVRGSTVELSGAAIRESGRSGLTVPDAAADLAITNTVFASNDRSARLHADLVGTFAADNDVRGNDADAIMLSGRGTSDAISTDQTVADPGVPFYGPKNLVIDAVLTIESGTTVEFGETKGLDVDGGRLTVSGTEGDRVTFQGADDGRGNWRGIRIVNSNASENVLEYADVIGAGDSLWHGGDRSKAGVYVQGTDVAVQFRDCRFEANAVSALTADGGGEAGADLTVERCTFRDNELPIRVSADLADGLAANLTFEANDGSHVLLGAQGTGTSVEREATWAALDVPYRLTRHCYCNAPLTIAAGTTVEAQPEKAFYVPDGSLTADASNAEESIVFTDVADADGNWRGLSFNTASEANRLRNVVVENAGNGLWTGNWNSNAAIYVYGGEDNGMVQVLDSTVRDSPNHGIAKASSGVLSCGNVRFEGIGGNAVHEMHTGAIQPC